MKCIQKSQLLSDQCTQKTRSWLRHVISLAFLLMFIFFVFKSFCPTLISSLRVIATKPLISTFRTQLSSCPDYRLLHFSSILKSVLLLPFHISDMLSYWRNIFLIAMTSTLFNCENHHKSFTVYNIVWFTSIYWSNNSSYFYTPWTRAFD